MTTWRAGPGQALRKGRSRVQAVDPCGDECQAEAWFGARRWPHGLHCPDGDGRNVSPRSLE